MTCKLEKINLKKGISFINLPLALSSCLVISQHNLCELTMIAFNAFGWTLAPFSSIQAQKHETIGETCGVFRLLSISFIPTIPNHDIEIADSPKTKMLPKNLNLSSPSKHCQVV